MRLLKLIVGRPINTPIVFGQGVVLANHPNPFDQSTKITYRLPVSAKVNLSIFDFSGRKIRELVNAQNEAGTHSITFHRKGLANSIYIIKLKTNDGIKTSKMIIR
ncbi:MAG TPA: T9SS type A sorting domain-containing protein [Bacteroides sp.]|nr:T9SS type A sorting domain-containing protein [Bacteroides sp.]